MGQAVKVCYDIDVRGHTNSKRETAGVCMELLTFGGIPVLTVAAIFLVKRKFLWAAPVISAVLALIVYTVALGPVSMAEVFGNSEWRGFLLLAMLIQFGITAMPLCYCRFRRVHHQAKTNRLRSLRLTASVLSGEGSKYTYLPSKFTGKRKTAGARSDGFCYERGKRLLPGRQLQRPARDRAKIPFSIFQTVYLYCKYTIRRLIHHRKHGGWQPQPCWLPPRR